MPKKIIIKGARVHNLKNIDVELPRDSLLVFTGLSGSGKSSLAFDTIYAEGQRRYVESLSAYARQFLGLMDKPDVDSIDGLSPAISIDQRVGSTNPRSTVGTLTEVYDYLRLLYSRIGQVHCPTCKKPLSTHSVSTIIDELVEKNEIVIITSPLALDEDGNHAKSIPEIKKAGFSAVRVAGEIVALSALQYETLTSEQKHDFQIVIGEYNPDGKRAAARRDDATRLVELAMDFGNGHLSAITREGVESRYSKYYYCPECALELPPLEPRHFSFNSPAGACTRCLGLGIRQEVDPELVIPNKRLTLAQGAIKPWARNFSNHNKYWKLLEAVAEKNDFAMDLPVEKFSKKAWQILLTGTGSQVYKIGDDALAFPGVIALLEEKHQSTASEYLRQEIEQYMRVQVCPACNGFRLQPLALAVTLTGQSIAQLTQMTIDDLLEFFLGLANNSKKLTKQHKVIAQQPVKEVISRLKYLRDVGLGYLTLDRSANTLAGGELQRIRLATQLGSALSGVVYILDEPSIGLHQRDNTKLIETMKQLRDRGNTVIVVEHDSMTMEAADEIVDIGPGAGEFGGHIVAQGTPAQIKKNKKSLTGKYLSGELRIEAPKAYRKGNGKSIDIIGATEHNLKNVSVSIPLGKLVSFTGVSGSGKSTLMEDILVKALARKFFRAKELPGAHKEIKGIEHIDKVIAIDQSPIGRTPRSNPATYTGVFTYIRDLFANTKEAKIRGYSVGKFSFNSKEGRCPNCAGEGMVKIEMNFLPDVYIQCEICHGMRYRAEVLEIHYQGKNIAAILDMSVTEAMRFFRQQQVIYNKLRTLHDVGLGYVKLGQPATTLSGGEAQRVKLATELSRRSTGKTLYVLDEPTTGLHFDDIRRLLEVLNKLVDKGNTVLIIEHNLDVIKSADWVIDMGPEGGAGGGHVVAQGTPKDIVKEAKSWTGKYLKEIL